MMATVTYEGIAIVKGVSAREDGAGVFVECEFPMPVGTRIDVQLDHGGSRPGRVVRVLEAQQGAGMSVEWTGEASATPPPAHVDAAAPHAHGGRRTKKRTR